MPEGVAKEAKEAKDDKKSKAKEASPRRRPTGNLARANVEILDGSKMELDVDRKIRGHELLAKVCDSLNLVEKDYFGLLYEDRGDPRVWIDLEKRVSKMIKREPWEIRFAVKFYPPEPAQLQEELTRYQLVLAVRRDLLEGRLPCSAVTHALLASYLLQSELGDHEESQAGAALCRQLKLVPPAACTPELEEKVVELHKTHRGQTPAEAELNYLENAKKLAMYGVDLHPAKDSENVDITLGVCSSGLLVHREKLRINRFAWPKILKISYKRHNFYVKLRPGEFEQFESTVGFKLANHRAAKKLWKTCVEHHTFFRLMSPEPAARGTLFPRLGSRFRYSGRTHYESRAAPPQRAPPHFARTLSSRKLSSRSMDALAAGDKDESMPPDAAKRHTMPPQPAPRPTIKDKQLRRRSGGTASASSASSLEGEYLADRMEKKPPPGAVKVMPTAPPDKKEDKKIVERKPAENGTDTTSDPGITNNVETPKRSKAGGFGLFGSRKDKSPKDEKPPKDKSPKSKDKSPKEKDKKLKDPKAKVAVLDTSADSSNPDSSVEKSPTKDSKPSFTKPYEYTDTEKSPTRTKPFIQGAFSYEKEPISDEKQRSLDESQSPTTRKAGLAFNYAPGEETNLVESAQKRKTPEDLNKLKTPGIDYVQSAALKEQAKGPKHLIDPTLALLDSERAHHESPVAAAIPITKKENEIQVVIITARYNPKTKKLDDANGTVLINKGTLNKANGKIQTDTELINTKSGQVNYTDFKTGKQEVKNGHVDSKSGHILFTSGVIDPKTGKIDPTLAQQYCFVEKSNDNVGAKPGREVDLVVITSKYDGKHKKLDPSHAHVDVSKAVVAPDGTVHSNYGLIDPRTGKIDYVDPKTGKQDPKQAYVDQKTGNLLVTTGVHDPKSGKVDSSLGQQFSIVEKDATKANREVRLVVITSKYDVKSKKLDPTFAHVDSIKGVLSGSDGKIYSEYGIIDPRSGEIQVTDTKTGKQEIKQASVDPKTGNILLLSGVIDPRTGQLDTTLGQQYSIVDKPISTFATVPGKDVQVVAITSKYDTKNKKLDTPNGFVEISQGIISDKDSKVHSNFGILDPNTGKIHYTDPKTGKRDSKQAVIDPKTGSFVVTSGIIDPKTGKVDSSLAQQLSIVDKDARKGVPSGTRVNLVVVTAKYDPKQKKLDLATSHVDTYPGTVDNDDKVHTEFGVIEPSTGQITITDPVTGKPEIKKAAVDSKTGNLLLSSGVVDPKTGKVDNTLGQQFSIVNTPKDTFAVVPGKEAQLVVITSKYDAKHKRLDNPNGHVDTSRAIIASDGKVHSNFGILDPKTGKVEHFDNVSGRQEIKQTAADPKTGYFILASGVADPKTGKADSSLAQQWSIVDKDALREKHVNLVIVTSKYDPKNKKLDLTDAHVDSVPGVIKDDGKVYSEFGTIEPSTGQITIVDPTTRKQEIKTASVDDKTGNLLLTSGVIDPHTGKVNAGLAQQLSIVNKDDQKIPAVPGREVQLVIITNKYEPKTKRLEHPNGQIQTLPAIITNDGKVHANNITLDRKTGKIEQIDPKTGKPEVSQAVVDNKTGHLILSSGVVDPKTGKSDSTLGQQWCVVDKDMSKRAPGRYVNLVIITSKYDLKNKKLDLSNPHVDTISGTVGADDKVYTDIGVIDPATGQVTLIDPITKKQDIKKATVDPKTGNLLLTSGVVDPHTGHVDPNLGQQLSVVEKPKDTFAPVPGREVQLVVITSKYDSKNKRLDNSNGHVESLRGIIAADGLIHSNQGVLDPNTGRIEHVDPKSGKSEVKQAVVDPKTGHLILTSGVTDPKTGKADSSLAQQLSVVDKDVKPLQREIHLVIITTRYDPRTKKIDPNQGYVDTVSATIAPDGKIASELGTIDTATGEITLVDPVTGKREVKKATVDPSTGYMLVTSQVVDPRTGKVDPTLVQQYSVVSKKVVPHTKPVSKGEIRLVIITGKYDPRTKSVDAGAGTVEASKGYVSAEDGKIHTDFGIIDPRSGQIFYKDPITGKQELKQAEIDPQTGNFVVTTSVVDPATGKLEPSYAQQLAIVDKQHILAKAASPTQRVSVSPAKQVVTPIKIPTQTPIQTPLKSPVKTTSPVISSQTQKASPVTSVTPVHKTAPVKPTGAPPAPPKRKIVKIMVIFARVDPKTKKPDLGTAEVEHITGILDPNGQIETKYGVLDSITGNLVVSDPSGQRKTKDGVVFPETGQIFIPSGAVDPKTGKADPTLGMILSVAKQDDPLVEITTITGPIDPRTGKVDIENGSVEHTKGKVDAETGHISTKYGVIDPSNGVIFVTDTSGAQDTKPVDIDENNGQITITGVADPKTGRLDPKLGQVLVVGTHIDPVVEVTTFVGKVDSKKGIIEPKHSVIESTTGQLNPDNNKIDTKYGQIDLLKGTVTYNDPKTGKFESKELNVDPVTGQFLLRSGQINPKSGKPDKDIGRLICLRIIRNKVDPVSGKQIVSNDPRNVKVDPKTNQIWIAGPKDPQTGEVLYTAGQIDPVTGYIITIYGRLDPKTGTIIKTTEIDKTLIKVDPVNGQIYTATGELDEENQPLYSASQVDPGTGEIYTKLGKIDPRTGRLIIVKIYVITQKDEKGRVKEVDPRECTIDETTGRIITTKTVYLYQIIDPITGETIDVDPDDPRLKGARTTVTQTMTLSGKIDPITGRIKTEYGDIDPDTGDIDPSTAVRDPVTGQLILHYSQIDPSHFEDKSGNYTIEKETQDLPANIDIQTVNTHKFSTFGKDESPARGDEPKTFTEYSTSEHIRHQGFVSSSAPLSSKIPVSQRSKKTPTPPVVVKTTTKQLLTKNEEGVTHNVEQEVENLGTGEVTFSTHTNKAESLEPEGKSPYVTARAVTTRTATTHHDLDTKAKTQQMEEKTVAHTLTSSATRHEQRVLTQQVKTMVTTGDQLGRRGSASSLSSGDSGTPIDFEEGGEGTYYVTEPGSYTTTTSSTVMGNAPFGSMVHAARTSTGPQISESEAEEVGQAEGEVVSSQTISSKTRTVETITYKTERNGVVETRVEQKITIQSDGDPIDHDRALAEAIQEATAMNPDMTVEKIEIQQQSTQP
ncbi:Protein 4.1-like [Papilio xuthus]|uniref:Protein 4.1-like n=1 Tax=Papilio xuthus TaxID=66420 RepID=A0A194QBU0_PAPXU|nr:Protein 4.1-like [Papilio xuthus]